MSQAKKERKADGKLALGLRPCPRPCVDDQDPETGATSHHWMEEANGIVCKHCRAGINWGVKCVRCGHELIAHWNGDDEDGSLACGELHVQHGMGGATFDVDCPCAAMQVKPPRR